MRVRVVGDYKLYTLPEPTTIAARQSKQVRFLSQSGVPFTWLYVFELNRHEAAQPDPVTRTPITTLRLRNTTGDGLGKPLPAGTLSVLEPTVHGSHPGSFVLAGQDEVQDTPVGLPLDIELGQAMDVWVSPRVTWSATTASGIQRAEHTELEVQVGNDKPVPIVLEYRHPAESGSLRVDRESMPHTRERGDPQWTFHLAPGERAVLTYEVTRQD